MDPLIRIRDPDRIRVRPRCAFTQQYSCVTSVRGKSGCRENGVQRSTSFTGCAGGDYALHELEYGG